MSAPERAAIRRRFYAGQWVTWLRAVRHFAGDHCGANGRSMREARREILERIAGSFHYNESLSDTLAWAKNLPEDDAVIVMGAALHGNLSRSPELWAASDPFAAAEWLGGLPPGSVGDEPVVRLIDQIAWDPEQAFAWGATIAAPDLQAKKLGEIVGTWSLYAPEAVRNAIDASTLSPETKAASFPLSPGNWARSKK